MKTRFSAWSWGTLFALCSPRMDGSDRIGTLSQTHGVEDLRQLRMLLALVEQRLPRLSDESSCVATPCEPLIRGIDGSGFRVRFLRDRRSETLSVLPYRDRRVTRSRASVTLEE